jgi:hypothetical protein
MSRVPKHDSRSRPRTRKGRAAKILPLTALLLGPFAGGCDPDDGATNPPPGTTPDFRGRVVAADGSGPGTALRISFRSGGRTDELFTGADGVFSGAAAGELTPTVVVEVTDPSGRLQPSRFEVPRERLLSELGVVLAPRTWTLSTPEFETTVELDLQAAFGYPGRDTGIYSWWRIGGALQPAGTLGWEQSRFPIPIYLQPDALLPFGGSSEADTIWLNQVRLTGADEQLFWSSINAMESRFGVDLFRPAIEADLVDTVRAFTFEGDVLQSFHPHVISVAVVEGLSQALKLSAAGSSEAWREELNDFCAPNSYCHGAVIITSGAIGAKRTVAHELLHTLGFGHACLPSVLFKGQCERENIPFADLPTTVTPTVNGSYNHTTEYDVAFSQLMWEMHWTRMRTGYEFGLWEAFQGVRVLENGLPAVERCWEEATGCSAFASASSPGLLPQSRR